MYNYQTYLKQNKLTKKCDLIRRSYEGDIAHKQKINPSLVHSHKKRIEGFILAMVENPNTIVVYQDKHYEPRSPQKSQQIHQKSFCLSLKNEKLKIHQTSEKNTLYDAVPFNNTFSHRFRDLTDQSTLKPMRYSSINASLRIKQQLQSSTLNYLPNLNNKRIDKLVKNPNISWKDKAYTKQVNKSLLPFMHKKTYFQSLKTIFSQSPNGFLKPNYEIYKYQKQNPINKLDKYDEQTEFDLNAKNQKKNSGQNMNIKQNSRQALIKCGLLQGKSTVYRIGMQKTSKKVFPFTQSQTQNIRY